MCRRDDTKYHIIFISLHVKMLVINRLISHDVVCAWLWDMVILSEAESQTIENKMKGKLKNSLKKLPFYKEMR